MKLSVNILTLKGNEDGFLQQAVESVRPYACEVLIKDTSSIQFLGEAWTNSPLDIELTRLLNNMKEQSVGDWILKIDDDELFPTILMEEIMETIEKATYPIYSLPFIHISKKFQIGMRPHYIKRLFRNVPEVSWNGIYGNETLALGGRRISSEKCPKLVNPFLHLGGLRRNLGARQHRYESL